MRLNIEEWLYNQKVGLVSESLFVEQLIYLAGFGKKFLLLIQFATRRPFVRLSEDYPKLERAGIAFTTCPRRELLR